MNLWIKNDGYAFLMRLDLMFSMSLWKKFQLLQILDDLSIRHLIKLFLYENDVKLLKFKRSSKNYLKREKRKNIYNDIAWKYGNVTVKDFRKYEKLEYKKNKLKLAINFLNNCKQLGVYLKFLIFKLPNVSNKDALSIRNWLLRSAINKCNKELQHLSK